MIIVLVIDSFDHLNNGTTMTAYRFAEMLKKHGHEVRVVSIGEDGPGRYPVKEWNLPIAKKIANRQGFAFAKPDTSVFRKAFYGADVVHFLIPLMMDCKAAKVAQEMDIPYSGAFHLQPENITYILHLSHWKALPRWIYRFFYRIFYHRFDHIHCPSQFIADQLIKNGYQAKMHVISNGVDEDFIPLSSPKTKQDDLFHILMVGRLSPEKRQHILIEAISQSKYADHIQLHLAGNGPCKQKLMKQGQTLKHPPIFGFYSKSDLINLIHSCDLYVHASVIEIEAISCMEAFSCGLVPVICNSEQSATPQFALDDRSLFEPDNPQDLAQKIDYWIEHPEEKERMSSLYAKQGEEYRVERSIIKAELMFEEVMRDHQKRTQ